MFQFNKLINVISLAIVSFCTILFVTKYGYRMVGLWSIPLAFLVALLIYGFLTYIEKWTPAWQSVMNKKKYFPAVIYLGAISTLGMIWIEFDTRVGRYYAIDEWLDLLAVGAYPYAGGTNPSGFPFLFLSAVPFYFLGNIGFLIPIGITALAVILLLEKTTVREITISFGVLFSMPALYYEYLTRSELLYNMTLGIVMMSLIGKGKSEDHSPVFHYILAAAWGAVLSTRLIMAVPYAIFMLYYYRDDLKLMLKSMLLSAGVFILFILPFIYWNAEAFFNDGPFAIQTLYLPWYIILAGAAVLIYIGRIVTTKQEVYFATGVTIFFLVLISFSISLFSTTFSRAVLNSGFDISYFIMPLPFLVMAIQEYNVDRYLGRVYRSEPED